MAEGAMFCHAETDRDLQEFQLDCRMSDTTYINSALLRLRKSVVLRSSFRLK
jgi:hypothetical protein